MLVCLKKKRGGSWLYCVCFGRISHGMGSMNSFEKGRKNVMLSKVVWMGYMVGVYVGRKPHLNKDEGLINWGAKKKFSAK